MGAGRWSGTNFFELNNWYKTNLSSYKIIEFEFERNDMCPPPDELTSSGDSETPNSAVEHRSIDPT